jgi:hypothetical protein
MSKMVHTPSAYCNITSQKSGDGDDQNSGDLGDDIHAEEIKTINIKYLQTIIHLPSLNITHESSNT